VIAKITNRESEQARSALLRRWGKILHVATRGYEIGMRKLPAKGCKIF
jgi:hypothetical protein